MSNYTIPVYRPVLEGNEKIYVNECLTSNWISSRGDFISRFEQQFADYLKVKAATSVSNGTVALHLALMALGVGPDDEVIVPTLTYIASVNAIAYVGAKPVFVDSNIESWNMDPSLIEEKITPKTKAIMVVHLYGNPCDMDRITSICKKYNLYLIEDSAEAFGSQYKGKYVGTFGDVATFSFYGNKTITTGEGGMVVSNNQHTVDRVVLLKSQSVSPTKEYWHDEIGFNYRMTNICAAIGLAQLENANKIIQKKRIIFSWYKDELEHDCVLFQAEAVDHINIYWMVTTLYKNEIIRNKIRRFLAEHGIETRPVFYPAHTMPVYYQDTYCPVAQSISERGINLPSFPSLSKNEVRQICDLIKFSLNEKICAEA